MLNANEMVEQKTSFYLDERDATRVFYDKKWQIKSV
jgi:hypothetical protein